MMHAYILSGNGELTEKRAAELSERALCESSGARPCGVCRHCRKVQKGIHPDVARIERVVNPKTGKLNREIVVDQIRELSRDAVVLPNEAAGKVYLFPVADDMNLPAQNAFLKLLEEPPAGVTFLLCTENRERLLETVRSRCAEVRVGGEAAAFSDSAEERAEGFLAVRHDRAELWRWGVNLEKTDAAQLTEIVLCLRERAVKRVEDAGELLVLEEFLDRVLGFLRANVSFKMICGYLATYVYDRK